MRQEVQGSRGLDLGVLACQTFGIQALKIHVLVRGRYRAGFQQCLGVWCEEGFDQGHANPENLQMNNK